MGLEWIQKGSQNRPRMTLQDHPQTGPEMVPRWSPDGPQISLPQNRPYLSVLLTIAEVLGVPSKDWIRPPTSFEKYTNGC